MRFKALSVPLLAAQIVACSGGENPTIELENDIIRAASEAEPNPVARAEAFSAEPRKIWLFYADGGPGPESTPSACPGQTPAKFECMFGSSVDDCKHQIQTYLDKWYADFNVTFTFEKPASGVYY